MAIVLPFSGAPPEEPIGGLPPGLDPGCANYIGYHNRLEEGEIIAVSSGDPRDALDWLEYTAWTPAVAAPAFFEIEFPEEVTLDYVAIAFYSFGGGTLKLFHWDGMAFVEDVLIDEAPHQGSPVMKLFMAKTSALWRVEITGLGPFRLGVLSAGQWMGVPMQDIGWTPPRLARAPLLVNSESEKGVFLGRSLLRLASKFEITATFLRIDWAYSAWLDFIRHAEQRPFFFSWDISLAGDTAYCWVEEEIPRPEFVGGENVDARVPVRGVV